MMPALRILTILFSLCLHGGILGVLWLFSGAERPVEEKVYHVSLAQFAAPPPPAAAPPEPPPPPEPVAEVKPEPEPRPEPPRPAKPTKKVSPRKKKKPAPPVSAPPEPEPPPPAAAPAPAGPAPPSSAPAPAMANPLQMGGLATFRSEQVDQRPSISRNSTPEYPKKARRMNVQGRTIVQMVVDTSGMPRECTVIEADPPGYFEEPALEAARKMRFIPGKIKGQPVNTLVVVPFVFKLN